MSRDLRIAIIGAGRMGQTHIRNLGGITGVSVAVVADTVMANAEQGAAIARAERATTDIDSAIHAADVDAVVISTPTSTHADLMIKAAQAKKAIWCEKPVALSLAETQRVVQAVKENGVPTQLGFMRRYDPGYVAAKRKIETGEVGRIETFRAISRDNKLPPISYLKTSGGIFLDMAVHDFDLARFLVGEVEEVQCWHGADRPTGQRDWRHRHRHDHAPLCQWRAGRDGDYPPHDLGLRYPHRSRWLVGQSGGRWPSENPHDLLAQRRLRGRHVRELPRSV